MSTTCADAATQAFFENAERLVATIPGAYSYNGANGTRLIVTTIPIPTLNGIYVTGQDPDLDEVEVFAKELQDQHVPWSVQTRGEVDPWLARLASEYGKTKVTTTPLLVWDAALAHTLTCELPEGAKVRKIKSSEWGEYAAILASGYDIPREDANLLASPRLLEGPGMTAFVLDISGQPVATGCNWRNGDQVELCGGCVPPQHRHKGYARALLAARLCDAAAAGATHAFTQNTPMSQPLFESLGFRVAETWTYFLTGW